MTHSVPSEEIPRLPAFTTLLLAHAFRGIFYPSNFIYPLTARFLLQRPTLDPADVPMLYGMLYSSSDDWKKERAWIVRFLSDGIVGNEEWRIMKRRHTWDLLASLFQSEERDKSLRRGVLEVCSETSCVLCKLTGPLRSWRMSLAMLVQPRRSFLDTRSWPGLRCNLSTCAAKKQSRGSGFSRISSLPSTRAR